MRGSQRIFLAALGLSLLAHLIAAGNSNRWWTSPAREIPFPIETRLNLVPEAPPAAPISKTTSQPTKPPPNPAAEVATEVANMAAAEPALPAPVTPPEPAPVTTMTPPPVVAPEGAPTPPPENPPLSAAEVIAVPAPPARALRPLPERIALRYLVQSGEDGFNIGQTTYSGQFRDGRYSLVSVTEATGITALFVSGKIIQTSEGRITANGLQPDQFWSAKGEKRQPPVRFDWVQQRLMLPTGGVELAPQTQDLTSFPFQLAMWVREDDAEWSLPVTNGKKLRDYRFRVIGREQLATGETRVETLHLQGGRAGEGSLDVWLAPARHWLPVRIRTLDQKGKVIVLTLQDEAGS